MTQPMTMMRIVDPDTELGFFRPRRFKDQEYPTDDLLLVKQNKIIPPMNTRMILLDDPKASLLRRLRAKRVKKMFVSIAQRVIEMA